MISLRKAREEGKINQFAEERENHTPGDEAAFNRAVASMARTSKAAPVPARPRGAVNDIAYSSEWRSVV